MVMARAVEAYLQGKIEERRERWRAEGREEGLEQGIEQGRQTLAAEVADWNQRRLDAEKRGQPFDEPPPRRLAACQTLGPTSLRTDILNTPL